MKEIVKGIFVEEDYEGVNVAAIRIEDSLICVDAPSYPRDAKRWATTVGALHPRPTRFLFLTDLNGDRTLNSRWLHAPLVVHAHAADQVSQFRSRYPQDWIQSLIRRNSSLGRELNSGPVEPVALSFSKEMTLRLDGVRLIFRHEPGPMASTSWLYIPERKILFTGDSIVVDAHPPIAQMSCDEWIDSLVALLQHSDDVDIIVPGRGKLTDISAVPPIIEYLKHARNIVETEFSAGNSPDVLEQHVDELVDCFPIGTLPLEWLRGQILKGLERIYLEMKVESNIDSSILDQT